MKNSAPRPINAEAERIYRMMKLGCVCCEVIGISNRWNLECHHILHGNRRLGHWWTLPLCAGHHQGRWSERQRETVPEALRVAISDGRKRFNLIYGVELLLWVKIQQRLNLDTTLPLSKCVPRAGLTLDLDDTPCAPMTIAATPCSPSVS